MQSNFLISNTQYSEKTDSLLDFKGNASSFSNISQSGSLNIPIFQEVQNNSGNLSTEQNSLPCCSYENLLREKQYDMDQEQYSLNTIEIDESETFQYKQQLKENNTNNQSLSVQSNHERTEEDLDYKWIYPYLKNNKIRKILNVDNFELEDEEGIMKHLITNNFFQLQKGDQQFSSKFYNQPENNNHNNQFDGKEARNQILGKKNSEKKGKKVPSQSSSQFKNQTKIFITIIIRFLKRYAIDSLIAPNELKQELLQLVENCRKSARQMKGRKIVRSDLFTHLHYNLLFLKIVGKTNSTTSQKQELIENHKKILGINLEKYFTNLKGKEEIKNTNSRGYLMRKSKKISKENQKIMNSSQEGKQKKNQQMKECSFRSINESEQCNIDILCRRDIEIKSQMQESSQYQFKEKVEVQGEEDVQYINFLKECIYQLCRQYLQGLLLPEQKSRNIDIKEGDNHVNQSENQRFLERVFVGLQLLNNGVQKYKF